MAVQKVCIEALSAEDLTKLGKSYEVFFCEGCGKRITDQELETGAGVDKQALGIFCISCGKSVKTQEFNDLHGSTSTKQKASTPERISIVRVCTGSRKASSSRLKVHSSSLLDKAKISPNRSMIVVSLCVALVILFCIIALAVIGNTRSPGMPKAASRGTNLEPLQGVGKTAPLEIREDVDKSKLEVYSKSSILRCTPFAGQKKV